MARKKTATAADDGEVLVIAMAGFRHRGEYVRTGASCHMDRAEAADMEALNMVKVLRESESVR